MTLPAGGSVTYTATCTIAATATGSLSNTATVTGAAGDPAPGNNTATDTDTLTPAGRPRHHQDRRRDGRRAPGGSVTYTITAVERRSVDCTGRHRGRHLPGVADLQLDLRRRRRRHLHRRSDRGQHQRRGHPAGRRLGDLHRQRATSRRRPRGALVEHRDGDRRGVTDPTPANNSATDTDTLTAAGQPRGITKTDGVTNDTPGGST